MATIDFGIKQLIKIKLKDILIKYLFKKLQKTSSVMIWGSFWIKGTLSLSFLDGKVNAQKYIKMLKEEAIDKFNNVAGAGKYVFQQDNAPCHVAKISLEFFKKEKIQLLDWPPCSPDLNPIENLWGIISNKLYKGGRIFKSVKELKTAIIRAWEDISKETCESLVFSMDKRCEEVIGLEGSTIAY